FELLSAIKAGDLLKMANNNFNIGGQKEDVCDPYIERYVNQYIIDINFLKKVDHDTLILINYNNKLDYLKKRFPRLHFKDITFILESKNIKDIANNQSNVETEEESNLTYVDYNIFITKTECGPYQFREIIRKWNRF